MDIKRRLTGKNAEVESALKLWFTNVRENDAGINGPLMRQKAKDLAKQMKKTNFVATDGWFQRWKKRENIVYKNMYMGNRTMQMPQQQHHGWNFNGHK